MLSALTYLITPRGPAVVDSPRDRSASDLESEDEITKVEDRSVDIKRDESERNRICPPELVMVVPDTPRGRKQSPKPESEKLPQNDEAEDKTCSSPTVQAGMNENAVGHSSNEALNMAVGLFAGK